VIFTFVHSAGNAKRENYIESFNGKFGDEFLDESGSSGGPGPADHRELKDRVKHRASTQLAWPSDAGKVRAVDLRHRHTITSTPSCRPTKVAEWGLIAGDIAPGASSVDFLPPYNPDLNPIERAKLVRRMRSHNRYFATAVEDLAYHWDRGNETLPRLRAIAQGACIYNRCQVDCGVLHTALSPSLVRRLAQIGDI
jgi:hypothetical protein